MKRLLVAVDGGPATAPIVEVAQAATDLFDATLDIVVVRQESDPAEFPLDDPRIRVETGEATAWLTHATTREDVQAVVISLRALPGRGRSAGHVVRHLIQRCSCPVIAVPPEVSTANRGLSRLIVPVEGNRPLSTDFADIAKRFEARGRTLIGLHIFDSETMPVFADRWDDAALWSEQFWQSHSVTMPDSHIRVGAVAPQLLEASIQLGADSVLIEWSQLLDDHHAEVVRNVLTHTTVPVLLIPDRRPPAHRSPWNTTERTDP